MKTVNPTEALHPRPEPKNVVSETEKRPRTNESNNKAQYPAENTVNHPQINPGDGDQNQ